MAAPSIVRQRLAHQHLAKNACRTPEEVVAWLGAVQAQDYPGAKWSLGMRMQQATDELIEQAFTAGTILRTHIMRPTWHFVTPDDIRWLLELTAPRVKALLAYNDRQLEIDDALVRRSNAAIARALQDEQYRTRAELGSALADAGIAATGLRLAQLTGHAELDGIVCSGPRRGNQFTYALLDERAPSATRLSRDEAIAELTRRYYTGHGPATLRDFVWWSGLTVADAKAGLNMAASDLSHEVVDGETYWFAASLPPAIKPSNTAFLLPTYDEILVGYAGFDVARRGGPGASHELVFDSTIMFDGQIIGSWRRTITKGAASIELAPFAPLTEPQEEDIAAAVQRYGAFVGMPVRSSTRNCA